MVHIKGQEQSSVRAHRKLHYSWYEDCKNKCAQTTRGLLDPS